MKLVVYKGGRALSPFRVEKLASAIKAGGAKAPLEVSARLAYFAEVDESFGKEDAERLEALLEAKSFEGSPFVGGAPDKEDGEKFQGADAKSLVSLLVVPRTGTVSPWSSKATDIAKNASLKGVHRIEKGILHLALFDGTPKESDVEAFKAAIHDRMTESIIADDKSIPAIFGGGEPRKLETVPVSKEGRAALERANKEMGLALSDDEIDYLVKGYGKLRRDPTDCELMMFSQANSEHCRHKIFNADFILDGVEEPDSLFRMIRRTHETSPKGTVVAYKDNSSVIEGFNEAVFRVDPETGSYEERHELTHILMKVETHNHPTAISPFAGAATGSGGEIRDEGATGRGGRPKAGLTGFTVSNLNIPSLKRPWEGGKDAPGIPRHMASPLEIMIDGPIGGAAFNNEFGRPNLLGYFRTFEGELDGENFGYHKPIMIAGGVGNISAKLTSKLGIEDGDLLVQLGGPGFLIGLGGGAASSMSSGANSESLDFASVQRGNPEMQRRAQEVIQTCQAMGERNPILSIHDVGAGGLSNAFPELVNDAGKGAIFNLRDVPVDEKDMSPKEIWCNESQERYVLAIKGEDLERFDAICQRERCPYAVVGKATMVPTLVVEDGLFNEKSVDMPMIMLLGKPPKTVMRDERVPRDADHWSAKGIEIKEAVKRVLNLPAVGSKSFLVTIGDRTVGGLTRRDQMVGPWQMPVADLAVTGMSFDSIKGEAMAMGERTPIAMFDAPASARMAIAEAITNIAAADIGELGKVKLSANWMAAAKKKGEAHRLHHAVNAASTMCQQIGVSIPVGKDSLSMSTKWEEDGKKREVSSPLSLIVSSFAPVRDVTKTATPQLKDVDGTVLALLDLGKHKARMGYGALNQVYGKKEGVTPDIDNPYFVKAYFHVVQSLVRKGKLLAYHDRSDGGLLATIAEMMFASRIGVNLALDECCDNMRRHQEPDVKDEELAIRALFNEEAGAVLQIRASDVPELESLLENYDLRDAMSIVGVIDPESDALAISLDGKEIYREKRSVLQKEWASTSHAIQSLRDNPVCADMEFGVADMPNDESSLAMRPTFEPDARFDLAETFSNDGGKTQGKKPRVAILREEGVNSHMETAHAFHLAGFEAVDVHMSDLMGGRADLKDFDVLAACGGFSYGDVLGAGKGWAKSILFNERLKEMFKTFFERKDALAIGICNGCQMLSELKEIIPGTNHWPKFVKNESEQFEARLVNVKIEEDGTAKSVFLKDMAGSVLPIVVSHGEGRAIFTDTPDPLPAPVAGAIRYVDGKGEPTMRYPLNPNGAEGAVAGLCNEDGRVLILMPHPERTAQSLQMSWKSDDWTAPASPWFKIFLNARDFCARNAKA